MNNRLSIIAVTALSSTAMLSAQQSPTTSSATENTCFEKGARWLLSAQSPDHGWGSISSGDETNASSASLADPATTSFVAMALLEAGGPLTANPHSPNIMQALEFILLAIRNRPGNGSLTPLPLTPLQQQLGVQVDVCMTLDFLLAMQKQLPDDLRIPASADVCLALLENDQRSDPQTSQYRQHMQTRYKATRAPLAYTAQMFHQVESIVVPADQPPTTHFLAKSIRVLGDAGIALCRAATLAESTDENPKQFDDVLRSMSFDAIYNLVSTGLDALATGMEVKSAARKEARLIANACLANAMRSDSLESNDYNSWLQWRSEMDDVFEQVQLPNGSWNGKQCTHGPAVCTAAVLLAWHGDPGIDGLTLKR
jgi:hypothetical protein